MITDIYEIYMYIFFYKVSFPPAHSMECSIEIDETSKTVYDTHAPFTAHAKTCVNGTQGAGKGSQDHLSS